MKLLVNAFFIGIAFLLFSCKTGDDTPDVSHIKVDLQVQRFEKDFFSADTNNVDAAMEQLHRQYPVFLQDFVFNNVVQIMATITLFLCISNCFVGLCTVLASNLSCLER